MNNTRNNDTHINEILDKIKADIEDLKIEGDSHNVCFIIHNGIVESALRIIDEYKSKSKGE